MANEIKARIEVGSVVAAVFDTEKVGATTDEIE